MSRDFVKWPFLHSGHTYPFPLCTPIPSSQNQCCILDPQVFRLLQTTLIRGWGDLKIVDKSARFRQVSLILPKPRLRVVSLFL